MSDAEIRAWAAEVGLECSARGVIPSRVIAAYWDAHPDQAEDEAPVHPTVDEPQFTIDLHIPGADLETTQRIEALLLDVVWYAHAAGVEAERARLAQALGVTS